MTNTIEARALALLDDAAKPMTERLHALCVFLQETYPAFDWVGFYWADETSPRTLKLLTYVGAPTEHTSIPYGRGVCGQVAESLQTKMVDDVLAEANYLSCSHNVRSEIVLPVLREGRFVGQLDIDSHLAAAFTPEHSALLEGICAAIGARLEADVLP